MLLRKVEHLAVKVLHRECSSHADFSCLVGPQKVILNILTLILI